jgi:predicted aldo/keto reductase-like oxidoreductase
MEYRLLGRTGVSVSPLCLGTMMFGPWGNDDRADAIRVIHRALDAGINVVDTADVYSSGVSEEITGEALQGRPSSTGTRGRRCRCQESTRTMRGAAPKTVSAMPQSAKPTAR